MANSSILAAFERMWQHVVVALNGKASTDVATTDANGLMSAADKTKLDNIATGATANIGTITGVSANGTSVATSGVANIPAASTSAYGVTKLSSSTSSTSTSLAATASAVKSAYDLANTAKTNAATAQTKADSAYSLAESKVDSLSDLGITATATELNYMDGVTSGVQAQLDSKMNTVNPTGTGSFSLNRMDGSTVGDYSVAAGQNTTASGLGSHAEGQQSIASGRGSHAEGSSLGTIGTEIESWRLPDEKEGIILYASMATGTGSHAEGASLAYGSPSHSEGLNSVASGASSHAEGSNTTAYGDASHAEGGSTYSEGEYSHAEGHRTNAHGISSHAEGEGTSADGAASHAEGLDTNAYGDYQHVQGKYNKTDTTSAHIVGNGESGALSNAHTLDWDGNAWFAGDVYVGSTSGKNKDTGSKKLATEEYVNDKVFSGNYDDLTNTPTIPTVGNGTVTITQAGTTKGTFTLNQSGNATIALTDTTYPIANDTTAGITIVYPAAKCTTFSSDSGTVTPLAVQKGAKMFSITRPQKKTTAETTTDNAIVRWDGTEGDVQNSKIIIEDVTNTRDTSKTAQVIAIPAEGGKKMVYGYCTDQIDGTSFIGGVFDADATSYPYTGGLAIGGTSGNLLWKGSRVATVDDIPATPTLSSLGGVPTSRTINGKALSSNISLTASDVGAAPAYTYGTTDLTAGTSALETGKLYFVYE